MFQYIHHESCLIFRSATEREKAEDKFDTEKLLEYITELR